MTRATLLALASRVEAATGADRELDAQVWLACVPGTTRNELCYIHKASSRECVIDETRDANRRLIIVPYYTASLDAAMSLVDLVEGIGKPGHAYFPNICRATRDLGDSAYWLVSISHCFDRYRGEASTLALALTASALRAIAGSMTE